MDLTVGNRGVRNLLGRPSRSQLPFARPLAVQNAFRNSVAANFQAGSQSFVTPAELIARQHPCPDFLTILETISESIDESKAIRIAQYLQNYFRMQKTRITGLRTTSVAKVINDDSLPPMIEWREGKDVDVLAFCKVPEGGGPCSLLMHVGVGVCLPNTRHWDRASIRWSVTDIAHLKELLSNAQHILGLLQWSDDDLKRLCLENCKDYSTDEYAPFATEPITKITENDRSLRGPRVANERTQCFN